MLLRKYMALVGIGSAKIDLILEKEIYSPGEQVKGYFLIKGGTTLQQLKRIDCDLVINDNENKTEQIVDSVTILTSESIRSATDSKMPFTFRLPHSVRATTDSVSYRFKTRLSFKQGVESVDQDAIMISAG